MKWNRLTLIIMANTGLLSHSTIADTQYCDANVENPIQEQCLRPEAAMSDNSALRTSHIAENVERTLPQARVAFWGLPNVESYSEDDLRSTQVNFNSADADLSPTMTKRLAELLETLKDKDDLRLHFIGHTDNQGLSIQAQRWYKKNKALSVSRAASVAKYFQEILGLNKSQVTVSGMGDTQPIASNATPNGMEKNRRVDLDIWYEQAAEPKAERSQAMNRQQICNGKGEAESITGFDISVDGQRLDNSNTDNENVQRCTDVALSDAQIRLQYDNLAAKPMLNVSAWQATVVAGETVKFQGYSNYLAWIDRTEVRIFEYSESTRGEPLAVVALDDLLAGEWQMPEKASRALVYRLRVYDKNGRFDETTSLPLWRVDNHETPDDDQLSEQQAQLIAYGNSRLEKQTIPVSGGSITLSGDSVPIGHSVMLMGKAVPLDGEGRFVAQQIIPEGLHRIEAVAVDADGNGTLFWRRIELKDNDWFYVGLTDITAGSYRVHGPAEEVTKDKQHLGNDSFVDGRLAFYTKGKWRNKYTVTASADTQEQPLEDLFTNFADKDPSKLLRRLDDDAYYPTYGDDSTLVDDAPTQGKFYAKIEDERSHAMWGNFKIVQQETDLAQINRGLYGAVIDWNSESVTSDSESRTHINLFGADPGTQAAHEEFRGTGGSLYYLQHQDITTGSERVQVEVRDKDSGIVLSVNSLVAGQDYQEDAVQGRIALTRPLPSTADDSQLVRAGNYAGHPVYLVVDYEYTGTLTEISDFAVGGRITHWLNDSVRVGVTGSSQERSEQKQTLEGIDLLFRKTAQTYVRFEQAHTKGPGISTNGSLDGGYNFTAVGNNALNSDSADAYQIESGFRLEDLNVDMDGNGNIYLRHREKGFSAPGQLARYDTDQFGAALTLPLTEQDSVNLKLDVTQQRDGVDTEAVEIDVRHQFDDNWAVSAGLRNESRETQGGTVSTTLDEGERSDLALQLDYDSTEDWSVFGFTQGTIARDGQRNKNNRLGLGGRYQINDRLGFNGEVSDGDGGLGALAGTDYRLSERTTTYLNYALDPDNANSGIGNRQGKLVSGARHRYSDWVSVYGEEQFHHGDHSDGLIHAYGVDLTPTELWSFGVGFEAGNITTDTSEVKRRAVSASANYKQNTTKYGANLEFRHDHIDGVRRDSWLTRNHLVYQLDPDWRLRAQLDLAFSDSGDGKSYDANYIEALLGYAYRPVSNDKLNALTQYKYLADQAPSDQFTASGQQNEFEQRSHVLSADATYDLTPRWSVGGKYAIRYGELRAGRGTGEWFSSNAQLGIVRLDWHIVKHWDALIEGRVLDIKQAEDRRAGFLFAVYRHFGDHVKAGVGYSFTDFSDDLTDLSYDSRGVFFNVIGKF
jgi:outer membrane protein OmpA-like peptidoglycan-associated protein